MVTKSADVGGQEAVAGILIEFRRAHRCMAETGVVIHAAPSSYIST